MKHTTLACSPLYGLALSLLLAAPGCGKDKPAGTTPPEDGAKAAQDSGDASGQDQGEEGKGAASGSKSAAEGGAGKTAKDCPAEVSDTPTPLFLHPETGEPMAFVRVPKGMTKDDLVEQNPFFYMTMNKEGFVSTCDAMVMYMAAGMIDDDPKKDFETYVKDFLVGQLGYEVQKFDNPTIEGRKFVGAVEAKSQAGPAKLWVLFENKYNAGKVFFVILEAHPNAFAAIQPTFKKVTDSLIVVPPETK